MKQQRPTPPNEWLYEQSFVPNPETGEPEEVRSNWCTQHMGEIPDDAQPADWPKYLYHECTDQQRRDWEEQHPDQELGESNEQPTEEGTIEI